MVFPENYHRPLVLTQGLHSFNRWEIKGQQPRSQATTEQAPMCMNQNLRNMAMVHFWARGTEVTDWHWTRNHFRYFPPSLPIYFLFYFGDFLVCPRFLKASSSLRNYWYLVMEPLLSPFLFLIFCLGHIFHNLSLSGHPCTIDKNMLHLSWKEGIAVINKFSGWCLYQCVFDQKIVTLYAT